MNLRPETRSLLRQSVCEHKVVFETRPIYSMTTGTRLEIGIDIVLYGTHNDHASGAPSPGCERCVAVWDDLRTIAVAALPPDDRDSASRIEDYRPALSYDPKRPEAYGRARANVELVVTIRHRDEYNRLVDDCEERCAKDIVAALQSLGVPEGTWVAAARDGYA